MSEQQLIPARHGVATFVPAGQTIKIINTSGSQVIDTWAFALPNPEPKKSEEEQKKEAEEKPAQGGAQKGTPAKKKKGGDFPSQEDAEKATQEGLKEGEEQASQEQQKSGWSSYVPSVPSLGWSSAKKDTTKEAETKKKNAKDAETKKNSRTWASYFPSGQGFSSYVPKSATDTVSSFAASHQRDPNKTYLEQLQQFSKTPVGAAGMAALTGSGYSGSMYAGYQAWSSQSIEGPPMEFMSMAHSRGASLHMVPKVNDTLMSNLRQPILTLVEDTSPGVHDTLIAACDPARYQGLGVDKWEEHGSCAENLVLALKELNERAGLKGNKGVGADVTLNSCPAPLNLFMNVPWDDSGDLGFHAPKSKKGDYVRLKAERDVVVVMSACPQDITEINGKKPTDAHFLVEEEEQKSALKRTAVRKRPPPQKTASSRATSTAGTESTAAPTKRPVPQKKPVPAKKPAATGTTAQPAAKKPAATPAQAPKKKAPPKPVQPIKKQEAATTNGDAPESTAEKKKPRKLTPKAKPQASA